MGEGNVARKDLYDFNTKGEKDLVQKARMRQDVCASNMWTIKKEDLQKKLEQTVPKKEETPVDLNQLKDPSQALYEMNQKIKSDFMGAYKRFVPKKIEEEINLLDVDVSMYLVA